MVLMKKPSVVDSPSGGAPAKAPRWDLADTEGYDGGNCVSWCPWMFSGYVGIYRRKKYVGGRPRGPRDRGARPIEGGLLSCGSLGSFLACTPSPLDHVRSKKSRSRRFHSVWTPFDIPFLQNTEVGKKTAIWAGPPVCRLVPKMI